MSVFFDTNILVYAQEAGVKGDRARGLQAKGGKLSVQALNEFAAVSRRKQGKDWHEISDAVDDVLAVTDPPLDLTLDLHGAARAFARDHGLSFYDALIVASAVEAGCDVLYSADLEHGRAIGGLTIRNPFDEGMQ